MSLQFLNPSLLTHRSDAVVHNGTAYLSGAIPGDTTVLFADQVEQVLAQIEERLALAGTAKDHILSATIWLSDVDNDVAEFNQIWNAWIVRGREPARTCVQSHLQNGARVEIAVTAALTG